MCALEQDSASELEEPTAQELAAMEQTLGEPDLLSSPQLRYLVDTGKDLIVLDHGPGAHHRLLEAGRKSTEVTHAFFTHLHYDHCMDYARLVLQRWDVGAGHVPELSDPGFPLFTRVVGGASGHQATHAVTNEGNLFDGNRVDFERFGDEPREGAAVFGDVAARIVAEINRGEAELGNPGPV